MRWKRLAAASLLVLAALTAGTILTDRLASAREARAEAAYPPQGQFIEVGGRRLHAVVTGSGPDLVLIHGANGSARDFSFDLIDRLATRYRVIAFDRPGLGWSDRARPGYAAAFADGAESPQEQAALLAVAAQKLGANRPLVLGHSFGGIVALAWALDHDPAALIMLGGVANPWPGRLDWIYRVNGTPVGGGVVAPLIAAYAPKARIRRAVEGVFAPQRPPAGYADHLGVDMFVRRSAFRANARQVNLLRPHVVRMSERYDTLDLPIELVQGGEDVTVPLAIHAGPLADRVQSARLTVLPGVGHMPHHADPKAVIDAVDRAAERAGLR